MYKKDFTVHIVKKGETLQSIAEIYGIKVTAVIFANPYSDVYNIQAGDELCIPGSGRYLKKV